jgi:hypothetical protein
MTTVANEPDLVSVASVARELHRFEMHVNPAGHSHRKSELSLRAFRELGFDRAAALWLCPGDYNLKPATLERFATEVDGGWRLDPPTPANADAWRSLLRGDMRLLVEAPDDGAWILNAIKRLHAPILYYIGGNGMTYESTYFAMRRAEETSDCLLFGFGPSRQTVSILGCGLPFEVAIAALASVPQRWITAKEGRILLKGGFRFLPRGAPGTLQEHWSDL